MLKLISSPDTGTHVVSTIVIVAFVVICILLLVRPVSETPLVTGFLGVISAKFVSVVDHYIQMAKNRLMDRAAATAAAQTPQA